MKKPYYLYVAIALALTVAMPVVSHADDSMPAQDTDSPAMNAGPQNGDSHMQMPPMPLQNQNGQGPNPGQSSIRDRIRSDYQTQLQNVKNNQDSRNMLLEHRTASSTEGIVVRMENMNDDRNGSSTRPIPRMMVPQMAARFASSSMPDQEDKHGNKMNMFEERKRFVGHQLEVALNNLTNIRERLDSRIQKEQSDGHDMSEAVSLLVTADIKIKTATNAISALSSFMPATSTDSIATSTDLDTARDLNSTAQSAIKDAQKSLNDVVTAIAHALGVKLPSPNASSTPDDDQSTSQ